MRLLVWRLTGFSRNAVGIAMTGLIFSENSLNFPHHLLRENLENFPSSRKKFIEFFTITRYPSQKKIYDFFTLHSNNINSCAKSTRAFSCSKRFSGITSGIIVGSALITYFKSLINCSRLPALVCRYRARKT